jgi:hypothetical protein
MELCLVKPEDYSEVYRLRENTALDKKHRELTVKDLPRGSRIPEQQDFSLNA